MMQQGRFLKEIVVFIFIVMGFVLMARINAHAAEKNQLGVVRYNIEYNGKQRGEGPVLILQYFNNTATIQGLEENSDRKQIDGLAKETTYFDYNTQKILNKAVSEKIGTFYYETPFSKLDELTYTDETTTILGYKCKLAKMNLRSNRIDIWYTEEAGIQGTPYQATANTPGLVLKIERNGNFEIVARSIEFNKNTKIKSLIPDDLGELVPQVEYQSRLRESLVHTVSVFDHVQLNYQSDYKSPQVLDSEKIMHFAKGTVALRKIKLPDLPDHYSIFAEVVQCSNGDAYDRTGSAFIIPTDSVHSFLDGMTKGVDSLPSFFDKNGQRYEGMVATNQYLPPVELVRFFTPFGVRHFNNDVQVKGQTWADSAYYKQDVSELRHYLKNEVWIGAYIANYDKGGHYLSLKLKYYPGRQVVNEKAENSWQMPLFESLNLLEVAGQNYPAFFATDTLSVSFTVPEKVKNLQLRYITTGHGGWGGGDEFNQKTNEIFIDGELVFSYIPWRTDCAVYRNLNPASGNFWNGLSSCDISRSGWCPGSLTNPVYVPLPDLKPGNHVIKIAIPQGEKEGNSQSHWNVSGILLGEKE